MGVARTDSSKNLVPSEDRRHAVNSHVCATRLASDAAGPSPEPPRRTPNPLPPLRASAAKGQGRVPKGRVEAARDCSASVPTRGDSNQSLDFAEHAGEDTCATAELSLGTSLATSPPAYF